MLRSLISGISGLRNFQQQMDVIGNNIANVNTHGYKAGRVSFADTFSQSVGNFGVDNASINQIGTGVDTQVVQSIHTTGTLQRTENNLDMFIDSEGYFVVENNRSGENFLTRDGHFKLDQEGYLTTFNGLRVQGFSNADLNNLGDLRIQVPTAAPAGVDISNWSVSERGEIIMFLTDGTTAIAGQILLQKVKDPDALKKEGGNLYSRTDLAGPIDWNTNPGRPNENGIGKVRVGALELSNVELGEEFSSMITTQRAYQASARIITTSDEMLQEVVNLKR